MTRPLAVRCGAFGDMVLFTAMIRQLHARFGSPVDIVTSGPWTVPLLQGQPGVGQIWSVRSRKTPYWLSADQRRVVRYLRARGIGPTWFCDGSDAARPLLRRAGIPEQYVVDVKDHPLLPGEHATEQWVRLAQLTPTALVTAGARDDRGGGVAAGEHDGDAGGAVAQSSGELVTADAKPAQSHGVKFAAVEAAVSPGCELKVSGEQRLDLEVWLRQRGLAGQPLILIQIGNKRTMRHGLRRLAVNSKYWPNERWAEVLRHVRRVCPEHVIVMLGTGPEYALNQAVAALANFRGLHNAADDLPIPRLAALLAHGDGLITVDSGPAHAAAAVGCPLVVLFGKALPSLYRPWGTAGADVKVLCGEVDGEPDMLGIDTVSVISAWSRLKLRSERS